MLNIKEAIKKRKYYKKKEKERIIAEKKLDKEVEEEYKKLYPKQHEDLPNKMAKGMAQFFDMLWPDDEEQIDKEYDELLTEKEKEIIAEAEKEEKRTLRLAIIIIVSVVIVVTAIFKTVVYLSRSHYEKVISPMIIEYFKTHYSAEIETVNNNLICYQVKDENDRPKQECTNLLITTTSNNKRVLTIGDDYKGDDVNQESFRTSYKADFENQFNDIRLVYDEAQLSYKDFYHDYNSYLDYMNILPVGMTYNEMVNTGKITVQGKVLYQGDLSVERVQYFLQSYSDDSVLYFIKLNQGLPHRLSIISKTSAFEVNVSNSLRLTNQDITFYELDRTLNGTSAVEYKDVSTHGIRLSQANKKYRNKKITYTFDYGKYFNFTFARKKHKEPEKPHYYILKFSNNSFINNFVLFTGRKGNYREIDKDQYPMFVYMTLGDETYLIGNQSFGMALKTEKKDTFWCNLGLC